MSFPAAHSPAPSPTSCPSLPAIRGTLALGSSARRRLTPRQSTSSGERGDSGAEVRCAGSAQRGAPDYAPGTPRAVLKPCCRKGPSRIADAIGTSSTGVDYNGCYFQVGPAFCPPPPARSPRPPQIVARFLTKPALTLASSPHPTPPTSPHPNRCTPPHSQNLGKSLLFRHLYNCGCRHKASLPLTWAASRECVGGTAAAANLPSACRVRKASGGDWQIGFVTRNVCHIGERGQGGSGSPAMAPLFSTERSRCRCHLLHSRHAMAAGRVGHGKGPLPAALAVTSCSWPSAHGRNPRCRSATWSKQAAAGHTQACMPASCPSFEHCYCEMLTVEAMRAAAC